MSVLHDIAAELAEVERDLASGNLSADEAERLRGRIAEIRRRVGDPDAVWVNATEAQRMIGVNTEHTIKDWARRGLLRSRTLPDGGVQVHLDDVQRRAAEQDELNHPWSGAMTQEELDILAETRPGTPPWKRSPQAGSPSPAA